MFQTLPALTQNVSRQGRDYKCVKILVATLYNVICYYVDSKTKTYTEHVVPDEYDDFYCAYSFENGVLNRKKLAQKAFASPQATQKLNEITLPAIVLKIKEIIINIKYFIIK